MSDEEGKVPPPSDEAGDAAPPAQHEFTSQENQTIDDLAKAMRWVALPFVFLGVLYVFSSVIFLVQVFQRPENVFAIIYVLLVAIMFLFLGHWTRQAAEAFQQIVSTTGRDISHLMAALESLRKKYSLLSLLVKIYLGLVAITMIVALVTMLVTRGS